jgi:hypothetical protein
LLPAWRLPVQSEALLQGADGVATAAGWGLPGLAYTGGRGRLQLWPSAHGPLETARAWRPALQGVGCCSCVLAPCVAPRLASGGGHRRTCARKEPVEPSRWMTRPAEHRRSRVAGSTWSLDSPSHATAAARALALACRRPHPRPCSRRTRAWTAARGCDDARTLGQIFFN